MKQTAMRFGDFLWPNNPHTLRVIRQRALRQMLLPGAGTVVQDLGGLREVRGEGEFLGEERFADFERLALLWQEGGARLLCLPGEAPFPARLYQLERIGQPGEALRYQVSFLEDREETQMEIAQERQEGLWAESARRGVPVEALLQGDGLEQEPLQSEGRGIGCVYRA